jgi:hypothetical protein
VVHSESGRSQALGLSSSFGGCCVCRTSLVGRSRARAAGC